MALVTKLDFGSHVYQVAATGHLNSRNRASGSPSPIERWSRAATANQRQYSVDQLLALASQPACTRGQALRDSSGWPSVTPGQRSGHSRVISTTTSG